MVVSFHCCTGIAEAVNLKGEQAYFGSWPWRFWSTELWSCCFGSVVAQHTVGRVAQHTAGRVVTVETCPIHGNRDRNRCRGRDWGPTISQLGACP